MKFRLARCAAVTGLCLLSLGSPMAGRSTAAVRAVTVSACDPDTTRPGAVRSVDVDDAWLADGRIAAVMNNPGAVNPGIGAPPPTPGAFGGTPLCVVGPVTDGTPLPARWIFCLDYGVPACGEAPLRDSGRQGGRTPLSALQRARIAYVLGPLADYSTSTTRSLMAQYIWCVTENSAPGGPLPDPRPGAVCPDWTAVDGTLAPEPALTVTPVPAEAEPGSQVRFTVDSTAPALTVERTGLDGLELCPGQGGATLAADLLTLAPGSSTVALCAVRNTAGPGLLKLGSAQPVERTESFMVSSGTDDNCQGFVDSRRTSRTLTATADATWAAREVTAVTSPSSPRPEAAPPTTDASASATAPASVTAPAESPERPQEQSGEPGRPELADTGTAVAPWGAAAALALVTVGVAVRRRRS
ncbi:hypothetical protein OHV05_31410 [Kitasatospora sp. NBC_00070]|uniref:hypothetical protein n=1 Tax=Kitasatospora sp. NBC_00070 TaxID=2975962 RepID=UPI00324A7D19